jgi:hypothetical protein
MMLGEGGSDVLQLCQQAYPFGAMSPCRFSREVYPAQVKNDYATDLSAAPGQLPFNYHHPIYEMDAN